VPLHQGRRNQILSGVGESRIVSKHLLVVDDEPNIRRILQVAFDKVGYKTLIAEDGAHALAMLQSEPVDVVLTDVTMPGITGYELLREIKSKRPDLPVIIMTAYGTIPQAIQAIRDGAFEYVTKPFDLDVVKKTVQAALAAPAPQKSSRSRSASADPPFLAESAPMKEVLELVRQVAESRATVMIGGESGVGKEVVAKALHRLSGRDRKPFVAVSCAAIPEGLLEAELFGYEKGAFTGAQGAKAGKFESANEGTLFLDEVGEIPLPIQVKLLRVLQEREVERLGANRPTKIDLRLITATHQNLEESVAKGSFRLDLLYRLKVVELYIPPLRDRLEDIMPLAHLFLKRHAEENGRGPLKVGSAVEKLLLSYDWPGNVRELENSMERATVLAPSGAEELLPSLLPPQFKKCA
jgi:DNA-binding NtrC family response regulator